ncbi:unnamed protein product [Parnassius apollo]|uniref:(apollo) hypothetical protein n=1 Tax=Parnassius apollo TaxID=110799 RepID=A0A8S3WMY5_PARAO|nr:unnamed protein product [Parnassius apollo]
MLGALNDGVNVKGYFVWNLMDDFGWDSGYTTKHGLYEVDMNDPARTRTPRKSAFVYKEIIRSRTVDFDYDPDLNNEDFIYKIISNEC